MTEDEAAIAHGGAIDEARLRYAHAPEPWIDLSTGINPFPYPLPALLPEVWARLPLRCEELELKRAAANRYGAADPESVVAAPGTQALIQIIPRLIGPSRVAILSPTYAEHAIAWKREGHHVREVTTLAEAQGADVIVAVNPNNPTGRLIPPGELAQAALVLAARGGLLIVDEAFMDVIEPSQSIVPRLPPATIVLRSFGKMYGLAGLRLGFAIAEAALSQRLCHLLGPWAVSGPALAIGARALADDAWLAKVRHRLAADAVRLDGLLMRAGCQVLGGTSLFRLAGRPSAKALLQRLGRNGILVRHFANEPSWLRFGIPAGEMAWRRLEAALSE
jgi:cobalamin biosynthetic protein CobC